MNEHSLTKNVKSLEICKVKKLSEEDEEAT